MRIEELTLHAYGAFTELTLRFPAQPGQLQVVHGPNEAGKSTTLRALRCFLFGFPQRPRDAFLHAPNALKVSGLVNGTTLTRRKGRKATLVDGDDQPVNEDEALSALRGVSATAYHMLFSMDHQSLRDGSRELLQHDGELGRLIFQAAAGVHDIKRRMEELQSAANNLFTPLSRKLPVNQQAKAYLQAKKNLHEQSLSIFQWQQHQREMEELTKSIQAGEARREHLQGTQRTLARKLRLAPLVNLARDLTRRIRALGPEPPIPISDLERWSTLREQRATAEPDLRALAGRVEQLGTQREALSVAPWAHRLDAEPIERLHRALADHLADRQQCQRLEDERDRARSQLQDIPNSNHDPAVLHAVLKQAERIVDGQGAHRRLVERHVQLQATVRGLEERLGHPARAVRAWIVPPVDDVRSHDQRMADLHGRRADLQNQLHQARTEQGAVTDRIQAVQGSLENFEEVSLQAERERRDERIEWLAHTGTAALAETLNVVRRVDHITDGLLDTSETRTLINELHDQQHRHQRRVKQLLTELESLNEQGERLEATRPALYRSVPPDVDRDVVTIVSCVHRLQELLPDLEVMETELRQRAEERHDLLVRAARLLGPDHGCPDEPSIAVLVASLEQELTRHRAQEQLRLALAEAEQRLEETQRRITGFVTEVNHCLPELQKDDPVDRRLNRAMAALGVARQDAALHAEQRRLSLELAERSEHMRALEQQMQALQRRAGAQDEAHMLALRERAAERASLQTQRTQLEEEIATEGLTLRAAEEQLGETSADELTDAVEQARAQVEELNRNLGERHQALGVLRQRADHMTATTAARAAQDVENAATTLRRTVETYLRKKLAVTVLRRAVQAYRDENEHPVLRHAGELLHRMSLGRYERLLADTSPAGEEQLLAVRAGGDHTPLAGLSDGTRDQVYLALRFAGMLQYMSKAPSAPPVILDDVFVHFDEARVAATMDCLAVLCEHTQVLLFTHHQSTASAAIGALGDRVHVLELPSP